jgi:hypothetical protein
MWSRVRNRVVRPTAAWLYGDHMQRLGLRNTMRMAKAFNRRERARFREYRETQYRENFKHLIEENGGPSGTVHTMQD